MTQNPAVGSYVTIPFGARAKQVAHVAGYTSTGRIKVRAWNNAKGHWMPNTRTMDANLVIGPADARTLPQPPK